MLCCCFKTLLAIIGVRVNDTNPDIKIATVIVSANSFKSLPNIPFINSTGIKTATRDRVIDKIVKYISFAPSNAACKGVLPVSICLKIFSNITMASSKTNPTERISARSDKLFMLNPSRYIAINVPIIDIGRVIDGITEAVKFLKNINITITTNPMVSKRVNFTSFTDSLIVIVLSYSISTFTAPGSWFFSLGVFVLLYLQSQ